MSILWTYSAGIVTIILAFLSLAEDFYLKKNSRRRLGMSIGLLLATAITMVSIRGSDKQHTEDEQKIVGLQTTVTDLKQLVKDTHQTQLDTSKQLSEARAIDTKQFLGEFDKLSGRVVQLQTQVSTTDLRQEAESLQADLAATRKSMAPPDKATLRFSLDPKAQQPTKTIFAQQVDGTVHLKLSVTNLTDVDAIDGDVIIIICDLCKYKSEPAGAVHLNGSPETQRNITFQRVLAGTTMPVIEFDVNAPSYPFQMATFATCHTCLSLKSSDQQYGGLLDTIYVTNPSINIPKTIRPLGVHPKTDLTQK